jgi:hypothetical protein
MRVLFFLLHVSEVRMRLCDSSEQSLTWNVDPSEALGVGLEAGLVDGGEGLLRREQACLVAWSLAQRVEIVRPETMTLERTTGLASAVSPLILDSPREA